MVSVLYYTIPTAGIHLAGTVSIAAVVNASPKAISYKMRPKQ